MVERRDPNPGITTEDGGNTGFGLEFYFVDREIPVFVVAIHVVGDAARL